MKKIFILITICFFLCACSKVVPVNREVVLKENTEYSSKITLSMVGNALIHASIYKDALENGKYNFSKMLDKVNIKFTSSDLLFYNEESIIGGKELGYSGYPDFNTPSKFAKDMINTGFNIVNRANEHILDKNEAGIINSCNFWNKYPSVLTNGSACTFSERKNIKIMEMNNIRYAFLSYTTIEPSKTLDNSYYLSIYNDERVKEDIDSIRDYTDIILVSMHWGEELSDTPNEEQKRIAYYLSSLGVNIIIGTHPKVIEPIEWIGNTLVIYSLGNFLSGDSINDDYNKRIGMLANIDITKTVVGYRTKIKLSNLNTELLYIYSKDARNYKVIPFTMLDDKILHDYKSKKIKYEAIIKKYDNLIVVN